MTAELRNADEIRADIQNVSVWCGRMYVGDRAAHALAADAEALLAELDAVRQSALDAATVLTRDLMASRDEQMARIRDAAKDSSASAVKWMEIADTYLRERDEARASLARAEQREARVRELCARRQKIADDADFGGDPIPAIVTVPEVLAALNED